VALAAFTLIPGFPLDGGRVLRSVVWAITYNVDRATRIAARIGQGVGFLFIGVGLFSLLMRNDVGGLWIALIGWFLLEGALPYCVQAQLSTTLQGGFASPMSWRVSAPPSMTARRCSGSLTISSCVNDEVIAYKVNQKFTFVLDGSAASRGGTHSWSISDSIGPAGPVQRGRSASDERPHPGRGRLGRHLQTGVGLILVSTINRS
jgi:hypothetical protein